MFYRRVRIGLFLVLGIMLPCLLLAQKDSSKANGNNQRIGIDSFLLRQKGLLGNLAHNLVVDTNGVAEVTGFQRNDKPFQKYKGRIIRKVVIRTVDFGVPISDTAKSFRNKLTSMANFLHRETKENTIRKNLFFHEGEYLNPYLIADNERHLRDQDFLQDAKISVKPVKGARDLVDVTVLVKDVLSLGGSFQLHNMGSATVKAKEDNLAGWGDRFTLSTLYDQKRHNTVGLGGEYLARNIGGSFVDGYAGLLNFKNAFNSGREEESAAYIQLVKPLVNPYMKWTYAFEASAHQTHNMYLPDSEYVADWHYQYHVVDAWAGLNMSADGLLGRNEDKRLRRMVAVRYFQQKFQKSPAKYGNRYYYEYADLTAALGSLSIFRQNFFKTQYVYGFGRNEDVPEGIDASVTAGWTNLAGKERPYAGVNFQQSFFDDDQSFFNYTVRAGSFVNKQKLEDMNLLFNLDYFSPLRQPSPKWKQRSFISFGVSRQFYEKLNEPLKLQSDFGLQEYRNDVELGGNTRVSLKAESVWYSPWSPLMFHLAPFVFGNISYIHPYLDNWYDRHIYSSLGGGIRTRNESLVFGTIELRGFYFPGGNFYGQKWYVSLNTNIKFKYNRQLIKRPEIISVN